MEETALKTRKVHAGEVAATKPPVEVEDRARIMAKTTRDVAGTVIILPSTGGKTAPFVSRMRRKLPKNRKMPYRSLLRIHGSRRSRKTAASWRTSNLLWETTRR